MVCVLAWLTVVVMFALYCFCWILVAAFLLGCLLLWVVDFDCVFLVWDVDW